MDYQDQLAIGSVFNAAIQRVLEEYGVAYDRPALVGAIAQEILIDIAQAGYKIEKK